MMADREELEKAVAVRRMQGYIEANECCKNCQHFGSSEEVSGASRAKPARCELNPAFWFRVDEAARCRFFSDGDDRPTPSSE